MIFAAGQLAGHYSVPVGEPDDRRYITDGFYPPEQGGPTGPYRWAQPDGRIVLPETGPGQVTAHLTLFDAAPAPRSLTITFDGRQVYSGTTQTGGVPWTLSVSTNATATVPLLILDTEPWNPPGDTRTLGVALAGLSVDAPDAANRARLRETALVAGVLALALAAYRRTHAHSAPFAAGIGVLGLWGGLLAYGDVWLVNSAPFIFVFSLTAAVVIVFVPTQSSVLSPQHCLWGASALVLLLLLITPGRFTTGDAEAMYQVSLGLIRDGIPWQHSNQLWAHFGLGQSLLAIPLYWLGEAWASLTGADLERLTRFTVSTLNQVVVPATALALFLGARRRYGAALAITGTFLLATPAIPYALLPFSEPLSGLLILCAMLLLWSRVPVRVNAAVEPQSGPARLKPLTTVAVGLCLGLAVLVKPANAIYVPVTLLYLAWLLSYMGGGTRWREALSATGVRHVLPGLAMVALGMVPGLVLTATYNYIRYSHPLIFGYESEGFTTPLHVGMYGLLFSPGKGIIYFAPPAILSVVGLARFWRSRNPYLRAETLWIAAQGAIVFVFHALWSSWEGNIAWGPRFLIPFIPLLLWPLGALPRTRWARAAWWALGAVGFLVAIPGALVDQQYYFHLHGVFREGTLAEWHMLFTPSWSQIVAHWGYLLRGIREPVMRPTLASMGMDPLWDTIVPVALALLALTSLALALAGTRRAAASTD